MAHVPALLTSLLAFTIYWLTLAPDLTWANWSGDGGELITAAVTLGIPHPPGYPTYTLLGKLISHLPIGTIAYRFNLFSAFTTALAAGLLSDILRRHREMPATVAIAGGLTFAWTPLVWSQATITEVYGLNLLLVAFCLWAIRTKRPFFLIGLFFGLSLTTHATSLLLLPLLYQQTPRPHYTRLALGIITGLLPLLTLPLLALGPSPVMWGDATTFEGWWWLVSGQLYHANLLTIPSSALWTRGQDWLPLLLSQFAWLGWGAIGWVAVHANDQRQWQHRLITTAVLYILYAFLYNSNDAHVLLLPALLLLSIPLASGLRTFKAAALLLPLILLMLHFNPQNLRTGPTPPIEVLARPLVMDLFEKTPPHAILMTPGDHTIFTLWYFQHVEAQRTDLILVDANLLAFSWYRQRLQQKYPHLKALTVDDLTRFRAENSAKRPFCHTQLTTPISHHCLPTP